MDKSKEPRGRDGQRGAFCSCGAVYFAITSVKHQHFQRDGHDKITWRQFEQAHPESAERLEAL